MLGSGDLIFETIWPGNTTPQAPDGAGNVPRNLCGWTITNVAASVRYIRFFNLAVAPTMGTTLPALVVAVPATTNVSLREPRPPLFNLGLWVSVTTAEPNNDNTAPTASDVLLNIYFQ
jgi:hypothetical protein